VPSRATASDGDQVALAAGFDTQDAKPAIGVVERDAVDQAGQYLVWGGLRCSRHQIMMEIKGLRRWWITLATLSRRQSWHALRKQPIFRVVVM
jgi:hypothetical protein